MANEDRRVRGSARRIDARMDHFGEKQPARTREDLADILRFLAVTLLVDDDRIFVEFAGC